MNGSRPPLRLTPLVLATVIAPFTACGPQAEPEPTIAIDSAGVRIVTSHPMSSDATCSISAEPAVAIGEDEDDDRHWFSSVRGAGRLSDGSIVAADRASAEVRIYDETGEYLRSMGRYGEGPGEFKSPFQLWIDAGDMLWIGDYSPWGYNLFTPQGEFVRQVNLTPVFPNASTNGGVLDNGHTVNSRSLSARRENFTEADTLIVQLHDPDGKLVGNLARMPDRISGQVREADVWLFPVFQSFAQVDAGGSTIVLGHGSDTELRVLDDEFNLRLIIRWSEPAREVTGADVRAWREDYIERRSQWSEPDWSDFDDAMISPERPVADLFPAISDIMVGRDGRLWVRQYDRPREDRGWLAFDSNGGFVCHLAQPPGSVWEFGADYVLLHHESELGIQSVRLHRLNGPSFGEAM